MFKSTVKVPGSCGELAQGVVDGIDFLITCPINLFSQVTVILSKNIAGITSNVPAAKTRKAVKRILEYFNRKELGAKIIIDSQLIPGKGMASSTADITGALAVVMDALGYSIDSDLIGEIALDLEPTDGTFLPGINYFDHRQGKIREKLGNSPRLDILIFSEKGEIDTLEFNQRRDLKRENREKEGQVQEAVNLIKNGIKFGSKEMIGKGATISAFAHQRLLYKPGLDKLYNLVQGIDGVYGINVAHSGTLIGLLVEPDLSWDSMVQDIKSEIPDLEYLSGVKLISGGIERVKGAEEDGTYSWWQYRKSKNRI